MDRRALLTGLGTGLGAACMAWPAVGQDAQIPPIPLLANLFSRIGAAVTIDGRGPFVFVIDTGAGVTAIADTTAARLDLPELGPLLLHGAVSASVVRSAAVGRLSLGGLNFRDLRCPILPGGPLGADGLIGLDVLGRFRLGFDIVRRAASLTVRRSAPVYTGGDMGTGTHIRRQGIRSVRGRFGQMIMARTMINDVQTAAFIDSGAQYSIGNRLLRQAVQRSDREERTPSVPIYEVTGQSLPAEIGWVDDIRFGGARLGRTPLLFADLHCFKTLELADRPTLLVGADILSRFRLVTLDFPTNTISLEGPRPMSERMLTGLLGPNAT